MRGLYQYIEDFGRYGQLCGLFIGNKEIVEFLIKSGIEVVFSEKLGKHSEFTTDFSSKTITLLTDKQEDLEVVERIDCCFGINPLEEFVYNREDIIEKYKIECSEEELDISETVEEFIEFILNNLTKEL